MHASPSQRKTVFMFKVGENLVTHELHFLHMKLDFHEQCFRKRHQFTFSKCLSLSQSANIVLFTFQAQALFYSIKVEAS